MSEKIEPCPHCGEQPCFSGNVMDWKDDNRYVELTIGCCASITKAIGWQHARGMSKEQREKTLRAKLIEAWNQRPVQDLEFSDTDILEWLERQHTLHRAVEALYVVDGYEVEIKYDGDRCAGPWRGETLREAYIEAMKHWDMTHFNVDLLKERTGVDSRFSR